MFGCQADRCWAAWAVVTRCTDLASQGRDWERRDAAGTSASEAGVSGMESEEVASDAEAQPGSRARGRLRDVARLLSGKDLGGFRNDVQLTVLAQTVTGVREEAVRLKKSARFFRQR